MNFTVSISDRAEADIALVLRWFASQEAIEAGNRWVKQLYEKTETLQQNPERCPLAPDLASKEREIRQLLFGKRLIKYRLVFDIQGQTVNILRVWHSARDALHPEDL